MAKSVMIVDDAAFMRMKLKDILEKNGYSVVAEAQNGVEAIEKYKEVRPEIVTMDITMPEMDGIEALKGIKGIDANAKVVMCSADGPTRYGNGCHSGRGGGLHREAFRHRSRHQSIG